jgi:hypothetical protein
MQRFDVPQLLRDLHSSDAEERRAAVRGLLDRTEDLMQQADEKQRLEILKAVGSLGGKRSATALVELLGQLTEPEHEVAVETLVRMGRYSLPPLCRLLGEGRIDEDGDSARILGRLHNPLAVPALVQVAGAGLSAVRKAACEALLELAENGCAREVQAAVPELRRNGGLRSALERDPVPIQRLLRRLSEFMRQSGTLPLASQAPVADRDTLPRAAGPGEEPEYLPIPSDA